MCMAIMACILIGDSLKDRINRAFIWVLLSNVVLMLSDALAFYSTGKAGRLFLFSALSGIFLHSSSAM